MLRNSKLQLTLTIHWGLTMKTEIHTKQQTRRLLTSCLVMFSLMIWGTVTHAAQPAGISTSPVVAAPANVAAKILPPQSHAYGKTLTQWLNAYWRWYYTTTNNTQPFKAGPVTFMPLPSGALISGEGTPEDPALYRGQIEVTLKPGTPFVLPAFSFTYECYDDTCTNKDAKIPDAEVLSLPIITDHHLTLDGQPILEDFWDYYISTELNPPAYYPQPTSYGATGAWYVQGIGFVAAPLSPGKHTLTLLETYIFPEGIIPNPNGGWFSWGYIYDNTWIINVVPPGKQ